QRLGFTVGRRNRHPWGTENHIIQFDGAFLELLGFAPDFEPPPANAPSEPFAGFCIRFLERAEAGAAMLVLRSDDAVADADRLSRAGLGQGRMLTFSRGAQGADGADRTVAFTLAFADLPGLPGIGAFLCQQHRPENFWNPAAQRHANGASGIAGLRIRGPEPSAHARALGIFADGGAELSELRVTLGNGSHIAAERSSAGEDASITTVEISVTDLDALKAALSVGSLAGEATGSAVKLSHPALGHTAIVFRQRSG
ncbi:MAG: VOC family protein, partial [Caulobacteraceae bacterium]|nr:VOC family protein [Caulobacter sp.]